MRFNLSLILFSISFCCSRRAANNPFGERCSISFLTHDRFDVLKRGMTRCLSLSVQFFHDVAYVKWFASGGKSNPIVLTYTSLKSRKAEQLEIAAAKSRGIRLLRKSSCWLAQHVCVQILRYSVLIM